jgi:hypothetical protein
MMSDITQIASAEGARSPKLRDGDMEEEEEQVRAMLQDRY